MSISQEEIVEITGSVWASFLGVTLREVSDTEPPAAVSGNSATATVHISGGWNGSVILSCSTALAQRAAAAMFEMGEDELEDGEVADALGELVNMIGGNLKCLLPEPSQLSLPTVSQGATLVVAVPGTRLVERVDFACDEDRLNIAVWGRREERRLHLAKELKGSVG